MTDPRSGYRWKVVRQQCFNRDSRANAPCWICGKPINYAGDSKTDPWAWQPDHVLDVHDHPELALDPGNIRPSHARCNNQRGQADKQRRQTRQELGEPSEDWGF